VLDDPYDPTLGVLSDARFDFAVMATDRSPLRLLARLLWWRVRWRATAPGKTIQGAAWESSAAGYGGRTTGARVVPDLRVGWGQSSVVTVRAARVLRDNLRNRRSIERASISHTLAVPDRKYHCQRVFSVEVRCASAPTARLALAGKVSLLPQRTSISCILRGATCVFGALIVAGSKSTNTSAVFCMPWWRSRQHYGRPSNLTR
jgi:hypothetical protein